MLDSQYNFKWPTNFSSPAYQLLFELVYLEIHEIITKEQVNSLMNMLQSKHPNDVELAKELIDQFRTKRIKSCKKYQEKNMID